MQTSVYLFGNSPACNLDTVLPKKSKVAVLGQGIEYCNLLSIDFWFTRSLYFSESLATKAKNTIVLSAKHNMIKNNLIFITDKESKRFLLKYKVDILPSLGLFAVLWLQQKKINNIYCSGITTKITDTNINGYFWDKSKRRNNLQHNLAVECLILSKMLQQGLLYEF